MTADSTSASLFTPPPKQQHERVSSSIEYSPAQAWRGKEVYVGSNSLSIELHRLFRETGQNLQVCFDSSIVWGRDARVEKLDGSHLIPFELWIDGYQVRDRFFAMIPIQEIDVLKSHDAQWGRGFSKDYRQKAVDFAKTKGIPFRRGKTCVEGGNCRIFIDGAGKPKAVIGYHTLILSMLALEQQGYFEENEEELEKIASSIEDPEEDSYRVAKNLLLCRDKALLCQDRGTPYDSPAYKMTTSLEPEKRGKYMQAAREFEAKIQMTKQKISEELGISTRNIAYLLQENFHIDLDVLPGPNGIVFVHNEEFASKFLAEREHLRKPRELELISGYTKHSQERLARSALKFDRNAKSLEKIGCKVVAVAGDFIGAKTEERINFMNGLLFNDRRQPRLYTNGTESTAFNLALKALFLDSLESVCPNLKVVFVHDQTDRMQRKLGICVGGLHCLTYLGGVTEPVIVPVPLAQVEEEKPAHHSQLQIQTTAESAAAPSASGLIPPPTSNKKYIPVGLFQSPYVPVPPPKKTAGLPISYGTSAQLSQLSSAPSAPLVLPPTPPDMRQPFTGPGTWAPLTSKVQFHVPPTPTSQRQVEEDDGLESLTLSPTSSQRARHEPQDHD